MKQTIKIILSLIVLAIAGFIIWGLITNKPTINQSYLNRLDEISTRLATIVDRQAILSWEIKEREMEYFDLNQEAIVLNDEASAIFIKLIDKASLNVNFEEDEPDYLDLHPSTIGDTEAENKTWWYPGKLDDTQSHQEMPELTGSTSHERFKEMAYAYGLDPKTIWNVEEHYHLTEWVILCITIAETSGWNRWAGWKNIGSVWSNDRWDRPTYALMEAGLEAIGKTLNNQYLWSHTTLWCLSNAGSCREPNDNWKRYATSTQSREANMTACLSDIYEPINPETFLIRNR